MINAAVAKNNIIIPINITNGMNICVLGMLYHHKNNSFPDFHY